MVSPYLLRKRTPKEIRAAMARLAQQKKAEEKAEKERES